jgi:hypothetical protein
MGQEDIYALPYLCVSVGAVEWRGMQDEEQSNTKNPCAHCSGTGACTLDDGGSCGTCLKDAKMKGKARIVCCAVCHGGGVFESKTDRMRTRSPYFVMTVVLTCFYLYAGMNLQSGDHFDSIFPVVGSLTSMIVTFYFSQRINKG